MATRFPPRALILVYGGLAGALAGLFTAWLWQRIAVSEAVFMADCARRDQSWCLPVGSWLVPLFASPVAGLTAGAAFAAAGVRPARNVVGSAVAVAVLTLVTCGAIEFATPSTTIGTVLPPTWVPVVVLAAVFMAVAWSATAGTRRGCLFVALAVMTAAMLIAMFVRGTL
jgi:hypothetical protein